MKTLRESGGEGWRGPGGGGEGRVAHSDASGMIAGGTQTGGQWSMIAFLPEVVVAVATTT